MKIKFKKYPSLSVRDNAAIENFQWKFFHQASGHKSQRYFVVAVSNEEAYRYGVTYADSHLEAREAACHKHAQLGLPAPQVISVVGNCRQERCTCSNGIFALHSERLVGKGRWKNSEHLLFRVGALRTDLLALMCPDKVQKHIPLWRAKRTSKG